ESLEIGLRKFPEVSAELWNLRVGITEVAAGKEVRIQPDDFVPSFQQEWSGNRSNVSFMTCKNDFHSVPRRFEKDSNPKLMQNSCSVQRSGSFALWINQFQEAFALQEFSSILQNGKGQAGAFCDI